MTVVHYEQPQPLPPSKPGDELQAGPTGDVARLRAAAEYAGYIGDTEFVPDTLRGRPAAIAAAILAGAELGLPPMVALRTIAIIRGRPTSSAEAQRGLVTSRGHELWFDESTTTRAIAAGRRNGSDRVGRVTWTMDDAKRAGISGGENWRRYPAEMLRARASAALARAMFADVTLGIPATEELDELDNGSPASAVPTPPPPNDLGIPEKPGRTRRRPAPKPKLEPEPERGPVTPTPPPDPQPEPPTPPEPLATDAYRRRIFATMRDLGFGTGLSENDARRFRLAYVSKVVGREVASSNDLTIGEASKVIEQLDADRAALAAGEQPSEEKSQTMDVTQRGTLLGLFAAKGIATQEDRLDYLQRSAGRPITSANDLTPDEATQAIEALRRAPDPKPPTPEADEQAVLDELGQHARPVDDDIPF